ncbi:miox [Symbiodinium pilosum]|uniref:Inositol oxygenase n=1 Tax=Symbiodinium pilosum TaxID=2952 RepID=A0A812RLP5_SYMPI|nr:miox [Symbiodinium pilosum]
MSSAPEKKLCACLVGLGRAGHFHMESLAALPHAVQLSWVVDVDTEKAKRIAEEKGCRWSSDLDAALADEVDVVIVASATDTHFPYIMKALSADKAVLAEKPISHELHEVITAVELAKSKNLAFMCGYQRRADRHFRELKRQLDSGAIGSLKMVKMCSRDNPLPPLEYLRTRGGIFHDMLIHDFDMLDFLSGGQVPESVTSIGHCYNPEIEKMEDIDTCAVMFKYPSGLIAMVDTSRDASYGYDQRIEAFGEHGMLSAKNELTSTVELATEAGHLVPTAMFSFPQRYLQAYRSELTEFIELVQAGRDSEVHRLEQAAMLRHPNIVRTTIAAEQSWKEGKSIQISQVAATPAVQKSGSDISSATPSDIEEVDIDSLDLTQSKLFATKNMFGDGYRNYETSSRQDKVSQTYNKMHVNQTVAFVKEQHDCWLKFNHGEFTVMEVITMLDELVDDSDPDVDIPNSIHDFQTAERIREQWPGEEYDWFHLVGLLHDLGKVMALPQLAKDDVLEQWAVVGDTFPIGCAPAEEAVVFPESFKGNPDYTHPIYGNKCGMYKPGCGISNLVMSWGHDEYMYRMLKFNGCTIPEAGLNMIRLHSFYPWHDKRAYTHFEAPEDAETLKWVKEFNKFDLYSKGDAVPDVEALKPYYAGLLKKYGLDGKLKW